MAKNNLKKEKAARNKEYANKFRKKSTNSRFRKKFNNPVENNNGVQATAGSSEVQ